MNLDLNESAKFHTNDAGRNNLLGHDSSDGTACGSRLLKFLDGGWEIDECISYG